MWSAWCRWRRRKHGSCHSPSPSSRSTLQMWHNLHGYKFFTFLFEQMTSALGERGVEDFEGSHLFLKIIIVISIFYALFPLQVQNTYIHNTSNSQQTFMLNQKRLQAPSKYLQKTLNVHSKQTLIADNHLADGPGCQWNWPGFLHWHWHQSASP